MVNKLVLIVLLIPALTSHASRERIHQNAPEQTTNNPSDLQAEIEFGRKLAAGMLGKYKKLNNPKLEKYINLVGSGVVASFGRDEIKYYFAVLDTEEINAYAAPGGYIFITKGALSIMQNEAELIGVLAHEISHINRKHIVKSLGIKGEDKSLSGSLSNMISGGSGQFVKALDLGLNFLVMDGLKPEMEKESDADAIKFVSELGFSAIEYLKYIRKLNRYKNDTAVLNKTHPPANMRSALIKKTIKAFKAEKLTKTNQQRFQRIKKIAKL